MLHIRSRTLCIISQSAASDKTQSEGGPMLQVTYHALQSIFQHLHLTKGTRTGPMGGPSLASRTAGAIPQPNGMGGGGAGAPYPAAVKTDGSRPPIQQDILAVFNSSNAQASDVGTSTDQVGQPGPMKLVQSGPPFCCIVSQRRFRMLAEFDGNTDLILTSVNLAQVSSDKGKMLCFYRNSSRWASVLLTGEMISLARSCCMDLHRQHMNLEHWYSFHPASSSLAQRWCCQGVASYETLLVNKQEKLLFMPFSCLPV